MKKISIASAIFAVAAMALFAQSQRWQLVRAEYGAGNHWVNVTDRVRALVRDGALNFRVDNDVLGGDPFPGTPKTLRLRVQDRSGQRRMLTFGERDVVNLSLASFSGEGGPLRITRAQYGADGHYFDVTRLLNSQIQDQELSLRIDNSTMGGDPAYGRHKVLTVWYSYAGDDSRATVEEGGTLELPGAAARPSPGYGRDRARDGDQGVEGDRFESDREHRDRARDGDQRGEGDRLEPDRDHRDRSGLQILRADYGVQGRYFDVTARLAGQIQGGQLSLRVTNDTMGGDPDENHQKSLTVWYTFHGRTARAVVGEGEYVNLPAASGYLTSHLEILRAQYGADYRYTDVTDRLNSLIRGDHLDVRITNELMGGDPAPDRRKELSVVYLFNGQQYRAIVNEKDALHLPGAGTLSGDARAGSLEILRAMYGAGNHRADVTARLRAMMNQGRLQVRVSNSTLGGDPAQGERKELTVIYLWQGIRNRAIIGEGETLTLP